MENVHIKQIKYFSMFSGIGGFELGIQQAYDISNKQSTKIEQDRKGRNGVADEMGNDVLPPSRTAPLCIGYSEIDKYAIQTYEKHFNHKNYGDATKLITKDLPDFDFLVGGFPCQSFSIAGKRKGFNDTRGTLFFEIARVLRDKRPRYFLLENVKGLLSSDEGETFQSILGILTDIGYQLEWQVLNSKNFGVPQNRERVFIVGYLGKGSRPKVFPVEESNKEDNTRCSGTRIKARGVSNPSRGYEARRDNLASTIRAGEMGHKNIIQLNKPKHSNDRVYSDNGISPTLNTMQGGDRQPFINQETKIRRLTPTECERLQGFPDGWTEGLSDTQRYKCLGNAVTVNTIEAIFTNLLIKNPQRDK